jgi:signal transduction histidine kinase/CheY-like chemotaxis protein
LATEIQIARAPSRGFVVHETNFKTLALIAAVSIVYFAAGKFGLYFAAYNPSSSPVWPPAGIAVAALVLGGLRIWPAVFLGAFFVNVTTSGTVFTSLGIATGNTLEAIIGAYLTIHYANGRRVFERAQDVFKFVAISIFASAVSPTIGLACLAFGGFAQWTEFVRIWLTWWLGDVGGFLLVAPFLILWIENPRTIGDRRRVLEESLTLIAIALVGIFVFGGALPGIENYPIGFVCIPMLVWSAFRFGQREAATASVILTASATWGITRGLGPWARFANPVSSFILPQAFMVTMAVMTLAMAAAVGERKRAEAEAHDARKKAEEAGRGKDQFLAMLGHELRNPLGALVSAVKVLESVNIQAEQASRIREIMARQSRHLARLVDDLLDIGRLTTGTIALHRRPMDIGECARNYIATQRFNEEYAARKISLETKAVWINGDPDRIEQILANLLSNALKHTRGDGKILLVIRPEDDRAVISVEDDGDGMSADLLPRVFDLFAQGDQESDRRRGGLGVGLTLVRRLVELHGGTVEAHSEGLGHGSAFLVRMPRIDLIRENPTRRPAPARSYTSRRILIVEDNTDARQALRLMLEQNGHNIFEADSGPSGVASALANHPDVALIDIGLPGFDGYEAARQIRSAPGVEGIVLVALTGYGLPEDRRRAQQVGFDAHFVKPLDLDSLTDWLARAARLKCPRTSW